MTKNAGLGGEKGGRESDNRYVAVLLLSLE